MAKQQGQEEGEVESSCSAARIEENSSVTAAHQQCSHDHAAEQQRRRHEGPRANERETATITAVSHRDDHDDDDRPCSSNIPKSNTALTTPRTMRWYQFGGHRTAQGYCLASIGRGAVAMSNIFLSAAFIDLASQQAGCVNEEEDGSSLEECNRKVYGFYPAAVVTNVAVISGVLSALCMPVAGAMLDCTPHRLLVGQISAALILIIQTTQIGTTLETWFAMTILQAVAGFLYQVQIITAWAYLPETARVLGETIMTSHTSLFVILQFASQAAFIVVVVALSFGVGSNDVHTAMLSQGINVIWVGLAWYFAWWKRLPRAPPAVHSLDDVVVVVVVVAQEEPAGGTRRRGNKPNLLTYGFVQVFRTCKKIHQCYAHGLQWFLLAVVFAEAAAQAFLSVSVVFLSDQLGFSSTETGIFFLLSLLASLPGSRLGAWVSSNRLDPNRSWQLCMLVLSAITIGGILIVERTASKIVAYAWGACIGCALGWFYSGEALFFSLCMPKGQEAELSGFFVYASQILSWLPPLVFSALIQANVSQTYGVMTVTPFFVIAVVLLRFAAPWDDLVKESQNCSVVTGEQRRRHQQQQEQQQDGPSPSCTFEPITATAQENTTCIISHGDDDASVLC